MENKLRFPEQKAYRQTLGNRNREQTYNTACFQQCRNQTLALILISILHIDNLIIKLYIFFYTEKAKQSQYLLI